MRLPTPQEYLQNAVEAFHRKILVISPERRILASSRNAGLDPQEEVVGRLCHEAFHNLPDPCRHCPAEDVLRTGKPTLKHGLGSIRESGDVSCLYCYPMEKKGAIEALVILDFDLPSLEEPEALQEEPYAYWWDLVVSSSADSPKVRFLQRSNAFLRNLIHSAVDAVIAADMKGHIIIFNDAAVQITGYGMVEALNRLDIRELYPNDGARKVMRMLRSEEFGSAGKLKSYHVDLRSKSGELIPISLNAAIVYSGDREVATIGFFHDLRETLRMKKDLEKAQVQLLQAEKMSSLGKLAAGVAHQINNPLGGIALFAKLVMEEYELEDRAREDLQRILRDAERCRDIVKELLEFARQTRQERRPLDINSALSRTLFLLENQALFQNITVEKRLSPSLPWVASDAQQINHVFMNIILNAAEAMEGKGKLTVETFLAPEADRVCIAITDTGPGIADQVLPHIFEPFFTTKEAGKGTGLGLSLVYGIIENHGGRIGVRSAVGEGTTFTIELYAGKH